MNTNNSESSIHKIKECWEHDWPKSDLESVDHCPVCGEESRTLLYADLVDNTFRAAPGKWKLWSCAECRSAYLDPRPTPASIHNAYTSYYTHLASTGKDDYATLSPLRKLRRRLVNGYANWRYGAKDLPASPLGVLVAYAVPPLKKVLDRQYRHLPKKKQRGGNLLDVGCGDGSFLCLARNCGWNVIGLDPDPMAVANAARKGLTVHEGGIEYFDEKLELFDVITLNHVIEHLYEPVEVLKRCHALLKPGGQLWLETPNIDSFGHKRFLHNWRGLETPRHLVLFNRHAIEQAFLRADFAVVQDLERPSPCVGMFQASFAMEIGRSPYASISASKALKLQSLFASFIEIFLPSRREFLTIAAQKRDH